MRHNTLSIDATFDLECQNWDTFVIGALRTTGSMRVYDHTREEDLVHAILAVRGSVWSHFGGRYDMQWFLGMFDRVGMPREQIRIFSAGARIVAIDCGVTVLRDSYALVPLSLEKAAQMTSIPKRDLGLPCTCRRPECIKHGYCSISRYMPPHLRRRLEERVTGDAETLWAILDKVFSFAAEHKIELRPTVGASAWATASAECGISAADWKDDRGSNRLYSFAQSGYKGGRVQVFRVQSDTGTRWDINSAYPWSLTQVNVPYAGRVEAIGGEACSAYSNGMEGVYKAIVSVPDSHHIPPLPVRDDAAKRLLYPTGRFSGVWTGLELRYAESVGTVVDRIVRALTWQESGPIYKHFCARIYALRDNVGAKSALGQWLKYLANSQTGKLAQKPERDELSLFSRAPVSRLCPANQVCARTSKSAPQCGAVCCIHRCSKRCGGWRAVHTDLGLWTHRVFRLSSCSHVHHAAYLTANVRCYWHSHATIEPSATVYGDTDSLYLEKNIMPEASVSEHRLGAFKLEGTYASGMVTDEMTGEEFWVPGFYAAAPKTYGMRDGDGKFHVRAKGIPHAKEHWRTILAGGSVPIDSGIDGLLSSVKRHGSFFHRRSDTRSLRPVEGRIGDRILGADGITYPPKVNMP